MILQPLVENAYVHGLSRVSEGLIEIAAKEDDGQLCILVRNSGVGLKPAKARETGGMGIGLANIRNRLRLHFGNRFFLAIHEVSNELVEATVKFPLMFADSNEVACHEGQKLLLDQRHDAQYL
jgi:two-component system LytT family sensor kinase